MKDITISLTTPFKKDFKKLSKRYRSLPADVDSLIASLRENPFQGTQLGKGLRKVRLTITSKVNGKSGGARVITHIVVHTDEAGVLSLLTMYDKSDRESISNKELRALLRDCGLLE